MGYPHDKMGVPLPFGGVDKQMEVSLMGRNQLRSDDVTGFVLAFCDEMRETEIRYGVSAHVRVVRNNVRGQITFVGVAMKPVEDVMDVEYARAERQWPSARYTSLHALLYALSMSLNIACQRAYYTEHGHWLSEAPANGSE